MSKSSVPSRPKASPQSGRRVAARVVRRVLEDQAYLAAALSAELSRSVQLDARERALATELAYGVLRTERALEARILRHAPKGIKDSVTRVELLIAAYQLLILERIPGFAAVDAAVSAVRHERGERVAGFANAVLRKLASLGERLTLEQALRENAPPWLFERLCRDVGEAEALALLGAGAVDHSIGVRLVGSATPEWALTAPQGRVSPLARRLERIGDPRRLPGYAEGAFVVQEEGAQAIALLLGAKPGERVLDACAGRGQKASLLAEQVGPEGALWATDLYPEKLAALETEFGRLHLPQAERRGVDWTVGSADVPVDFDRVLVDAPCSGSGTLGHRPEILRRLGPEDPARLAELATRILRSAASRAKPGGRVVFAVCSVLAEESEAVVDKVRDLLEPCAFDASAVLGLAEGASSLRLLPLRHGTEGYFVQSFLRRG
jgi:16S rRNA (cytosine967-C5)-methyltransferase